MTSFLLGYRICKKNLQYRKEFELETLLLRSDFTKPMSSKIPYVFFSVSTLLKLNRVNVYCMVKTYSFEASIKL